MADETITSDKLDKYPNYTPKYWYLSIIKPKGNRFNHVVAIRPLLSVPKASEINGEDAKRWRKLLL